MFSTTVPLDIFRKILHNKGIRNRLEAWLAFLCEDDPDWIIRISDQYPEFAAMYEQIYDLCQNMERVMELFSKELYQLDKNTVQFMIDEMQETINQQKGLLSEKEQALAQQKQVLSEKDRALAQQKQVLSEKEQALVQQKAYQAQTDLLTKRLIADGRIDDLLKASGDTSYRGQLLIEYGIKQA